MASIPKSIKPKFGMEKLQNTIINKKLQDKEINLKNKKNIQKSLNADKPRNLIEKLFSGEEFWISNRNYKAYDIFLEHYLNKNILDYLLDYAQKTNKTKLTILDDGAGKGYFLEGIKKKLLIHKIESDTTAISLIDTIKTSIKNKINDLQIGDVAKFIPTKKNDFIISLFGGLNYTHPTIIKEVLLKYAYSLNVGGTAVFGILNDVKQKQNLKNIEQAFKKRGFEFKLHQTYDFSLGKYRLPAIAIIIKRIK